MQSTKFWGARLRHLKEALIGVTPTPRSIEASVHAGFLDTYAREGADSAQMYFLDNIPRLLRSKLHRQETINNLLYMSRMIQNTGGTKHGITKVAPKSNRMWRIWQEYGATEPTLFVDFGCGEHDPIGMSTFMHGSGFKRALAVDQREIRNPTYSALSLLEILALFRLRPEKYIPNSVDADEFFSRLADIDLDALADGEFAKGFAPLAGRVDHAICDIVDADIAPGEVSMITSFAVFEHVMDVPGVLDFLYARTAPGGIGFHFIDLRDHRAYRRTGEFNEFSFLCEEAGPHNLNRLRKSQQMAAFTKAGFEILYDESKQLPFPEEMRSQLMPQFAELAQDDLETVALTLIVRRPT